MDRFFHSVTLDYDKCVGCTNCVKHCPTEAIRIREGKAVITPERCIDCGECIRACPHHAKKAKYDKLEQMNQFEYKIALPAPSLYGQFSNLDHIDMVLTALKRIGFDEVYEVSRAAELVSEATRKMMQNGHVHLPVISSACPAIVRLIRVRFPDMCSHVLPLNAPMETAACLAKEEASERLQIPKEKIGCVFITPCPAKVTDIKVPIGTPTSEVDLAISISEIFPKLADVMRKIEETEPLSKSGVIGIGWAASGGESAGLLREKYLAADGIENCIRVLEELEDERIHGLDFIELNACSGGCVGGVACVENAYVARARLQHLRKYLPISRNHLIHNIPYCMQWNEDLEFSPVMKLSDDISEAMAMMIEIDDICKELPGMDCGSCGAPSCRALAEDVVKGEAKKSDCIFILRDEIQRMAATLAEMGSSQFQTGIAGQKGKDEEDDHTGFGSTL